MQLKKFIFIYLIFFMTFIYANNDCPRFYPMPMPDMGGLVVLVPYIEKNVNDHDCDGTIDRWDADLHPTEPDTDGDGIINLGDDDDDNDGWTDQEEIQAGTNPLDPNSHPIIENPNHPPVANDDNVSTRQEVQISIPVLGNDTDVDNDSLSITSFTDPANGQAGLDSTLTQIRYAPSPNFVGEDSFTYTTSDGKGGTDTAIVTVTVTAVPHIVANDDNVSVEQNTTGNIPVLENDEGIELNITIFTQPQHGNVTQAGENLVYVPDVNYTGDDSFTYTVKDGHYGDEETATVSISVKAPLVASDINITFIEDSSDNEIAVLAGNPAINTSIITAVNCDKDGNATLSDDNKTIKYTPAGNFFGTEICTYTITSDVRTASAEVNITVSNVYDAPIAYDDNTSTDEDTSVVIDVLANDYNPDECQIVLVHAGISSSGGTITDNNDASQTLTYTPPADFIGNDEFGYTIRCIGETEYSTRIVYIEVGGVNDAPITHDDNVNLDEDGNVTIDVLSNDSDTDSPQGDWKIISVTGTTHGTCKIVDNKIVYTPDANYYGNEVCDYVMSDMDADDPKESNVGHIYIHVVSVQDAPVALDDYNATSENTGLITLDVLQNDSDADEDTLTITGVSTSDIHGTVGWVLGDTEITYEPFTNFNGQDSFTYTIIDGHGNEANATVYINVNGHNDAPTPVDDTSGTDEDVAINIDVLGNDTDPEDDILSIGWVDTPSNGTVVIENNQTLTYTPELDFSGTVTFDYASSDGSLELRATITIIVNAVNDAPVAVDDNNITDEDIPITLDILANDHDVEDASAALIITITDNSDIHGTLVHNIAGNTYTYTPEPNFHGIAEFKYTITDAAGSVSNEVTVSITVNPVADAPDAVDDVSSTNVNTSVTIDVLANDSDGDGNETLKIKTFEAFTANGSVSLSADEKKLIYTPNGGFTGVDTFTYTVTDGNPTTPDATATVTVTVS